MHHKVNKKDSYLHNPRLSSKESSVEVVIVSMTWNGIRCSPSVVMYESVVFFFKTSQNELFMLLIKYSGSVSYVASKVSRIVSFVLNK